MLSLSFFFQPIEIINKDFYKLEDDEYQKLRKLTLPNDPRSGMNCALSDVKINSQNPQITGRAFIACDKKTKEWVGWCLSETFFYSNAYMIFVKEDCRLKGIGKMLIKEATEYHKQSPLINECYAWSEDCKTFFQKTVQSTGITLYDYYSKAKL